MPGYLARFTGEITIDPPLTWGQVKRPRRGLQDLRLRLHEEVADTDTGQVKTVTAVAVEAARPEMSGYDVVEELQSLADCYKTHRFTGHIEATGEEGDQWRLLVRDGKAVQVYPRVVWPDETEIPAATAVDCPHEAVFSDGRVPCTLPRGHAEPHVYGDTVLPFEDESPAPAAAGTEA